MKSYLFVLRHPPHSGTQIQEMLDVVLTTAAFDQQVALLLLDDAVFALKNNQQPEKYQAKDTAAIFKALKIYEITELYIEVESLTERGLKLSDLSLPLRTFHRNEIADLIKQYDVIFTN
jgi:tRNA 2-thiouridine synthesizing protein C